MVQLFTTGLWISLVAGCTPAEGGDAFEVRDSAGVTIATNTALEAPEWTVEEPAWIDLGVVEGEGPEQFHLVTGGVVLADGRIVVVNAGTSEVRIFDSGGNHLFSFGGRGEGPGEFLLPVGMWRIAPDSLAVWDGRLQRLSVFTGGGEFGRSSGLREAVGNPFPVRIFPDGRFVVRADEFDFRSGSGIEQQYSAYYLYGADGSRLATLPREPNVLLGDIGGMMGGPVFGAHTEAAGSRAGYWIGRARREEVRRYSPRGELEMLIRWPAAERAVTEEHARRALETQLASAPESQHALLRRRHGARGVAERFPAHGIILEDTEGRLWVQDYEPPWHEGPSRWLVFGPDGRLLARATTPAARRILEIGGDHLLAVGTDELGVEHVRLYVLSTRPLTRAAR